MNIPNEKDNMIKKKHQDYIIECAKNNYGLISHGFLYKVTNGFTARISQGVYIKDNKVIDTNLNEKDYVVYKTKYIKKGSIIEFRHGCDAHCRDIDDDYWVIDKSILALCCEPYAKINYRIFNDNNLSLKQILEQKKLISMN
jgi:hypothetical protein